MPLTPKDQSFQDSFIASCKTMTINAILPASGLSAAWVFASDGMTHVRADYCGCDKDKVKVYRNGKDTYILCTEHGFKSLGKAVRFRNNWRYAQAGAR